MRKITLIFLTILMLSFFGCGTNQNMIGVRFGVAYFNKPENTPEITCKTQEKEIEIEIKIEDTTFCDKLGKIIDGKPAGSEFCDCTGDYQVTIDNIWHFYLHPDRIVVYTDLENYSEFTIDCSEEETKELYQIIEEAK